MELSKINKTQYKEAQKLVKERLKKQWINKTDAEAIGWILEDLAAGSMRSALKSLEYLEARQRGAAAQILKEVN